MGVLEKNKLIANHTIVESKRSTKLFTKQNEGYHFNNNKKGKQMYLYLLCAYKMSLFP